MQPHEPPPAPDLGPGAEAPSARTLRRLEARKVASERYRLDGEIARGGMGAILRVWDEDLRRHLAMKVILREPSDPEGTYRQQLARFLEEAQVTGQLDHPAIVPVHELGLDQKGQVYFTMHLVKGSTFGEVIRSVRQGDSTWTTTRALFPLLRAAEALAFAHERRVLHRDVKPANLMVGRHGETYVMDWGLARLLDDPKPADPSPAATVIRSDRGASEETGDGSVVGTPAYMAPEQARGEDQRLGPGVDIYALGAVLYELLAGHAPFADLLGSRAAPSEVWRALLAGPPTPLSRCAPRAPAELVAIAERAMAREPAARYPSMEAMAEDLRAYLEGRVVRAHAVGPLVELWKWTKRNRFAASSAAALAAVVLTSGFWILALERRGEADRAEQAARREAAALLVEGEGLASVHPEDAQPLAEWLARAETLLRLHPAPQSAPTLDRAALLAAPAGQVAAALLSDADWLAARVQHVEDFRASRLDPSDPKRTARKRPSSAPRSSASSTPMAAPWGCFRRRLLGCSTVRAAAPISPLSFGFWTRPIGAWCRPCGGARKRWRGWRSPGTPTRTRGLPWRGPTGATRPTRGSCSSPRWGWCPSVPIRVRGCSSFGWRPPAPARSAPRTARMPSARGMGWCSC